MISDLLPEVQERVNAAFDELREKNVSFGVAGDFRQTYYQIILYMQKRAPLEIVNLWREYFELRKIEEAENAYHVTWVDGVHQKSNHQLRRSVDVVPTENGRLVWPKKEDPRWKEISEVMKKHGFSWGGDWPEPKTDYPHYEYLA